MFGGKKDGAARSIEKKQGVNTGDIDVPDGMKDNGTLDDPDELDAAAKKPKKKLPNWFIFVIIAAIVLAAFGANTVLGRNSESTQSTALSAVAAKKDDVKETVNATGIVDSDNKKTIYSPVNAKITVCNAKVGKAVKAGEKLIEFDPSKLEQDNQQSQMSLLATQQSNQEAYEAADRAATAQIEAANQAAQSLCEAANQLADSVDAQGAVVDGAWEEYYAAEAALSEAQNSSLTEEQKAVLEADEKELALWIDKEGNYTEKYLSLQTRIDTAYGVLFGNGEFAENDKATREKELADARLEKQNSDYRISVLQKEIVAIQESVSGPIAAAQAACDTAYAKIQMEQAAYDTMYAQWQSAYKTATNTDTSVDTESTAVTASQKTQMEISSNAAELAAMTAQELVETAKAGLLAEFDGVISEVTATAGTDATQGTPLYTIVDLNQMNVQLEVSTNDYAKYQVGKSAKIKIGEKTYDGNVSNVNAMATTNAKGNSVVIVNIKINNPDASIVIGASAKVTMTAAEAKDVICVPTEVINTSSDGEFVYMIKDGKIVKRSVTIGVASDTKVEIKEGLKEGDQVISDTAADITEGMDATATVVDAN